MIMIPQKIALLTDSCADIAPELAEKYHIFVVPLRILCADGEYLDGVNIQSADIYRRVWKDEPFSAEGTVPVHIRHLREKLEIDPTNPRYLKVVWGKGYKLEEMKK